MTPINKQEVWNAPMLPSLTPCRPSSTGQRTEGFGHLTRPCIRGKGHHKTLRSGPGKPSRTPSPWVGGRGEKQLERCEGDRAQGWGLWYQPQLCSLEHEFSAELPGWGGKSRGGPNTAPDQSPAGGSGDPPPHLRQPLQGTSHYSPSSPVSRQRFLLVYPPMYVP